MTQLDADHTRRPLGFAAAALVLFTAALWGGTPVAIRFSTETMPPVTMAGLRFLLAAMFMLVWCRATRTPLRLKPGQGKLALITGVFLFVQISLFHVGVHLSNASHGSMLINTFIFGVVALEHFVTRSDRLTMRKLVGLVIAAMGVVVVLGLAPSASASSAERDPPSLLGDVILLASAGVLAVKIIFTKYALKTMESGKLIFWHDCVGIVLFAAYALLFENVAEAYFTVPSTLGILYQGLVVAGFCYAAQTALLHKHSASQISVFSFSTPLFGVFLAVLFRGDQLSPWLAVSALCVATGILLVNLRNTQK